MFVVPFFLRPSLPNIIQWKLVPVTLFLENHGKHFCSVEDPIVWLSENGFHVKQTWHEGKGEGKIVFAEIDTEKTKLQDFYSFEQLTKIQEKGTEECWRTFFIMRANDHDKSSEIPWNENIDTPFDKAIESIQKYMNI